MRSLFDPGAALELETRFRSLSPDRPARWGRLDAPGMIAHVSDQIRCALGEIQVRPVRHPLRLKPLRYLFVHLGPWPRGVPTAPALLSTSPADWEGDLAGLGALLRRAAEAGLAGEWHPHPAFGPLSGREWGWLIQRHCEHHLRQFDA